MHILGVEEIGFSDVFQTYMRKEPVQGTVSFPAECLQEDNSETIDIALQGHLPSPCILRSCIPPSRNSTMLGTYRTHAISCGEDAYLELTVKSQLFDQDPPDRSRRIVWQCQSRRS
jgi:hypothetical protein